MQNSIATNIHAVGPWGRRPKPLKILGTCSCGTVAYCRGKCRRCYQREMNRSKAAPNSRTRNAPISGNVEKKRLQLEGELAEARSLYERVCGLDNRLRWRRKIDALEAELETCHV